MDNSDYEDQRELLNQENVVEEVDKMEEVLHDEDEEEDMVYEDEDRDVEYEDEVKEKEDVEQLESSKKYQEGKFVCVCYVTVCFKLSISYPLQFKNTCLFIPHSIKCTWLHL